MTAMMAVSPARAPALSPDGDATARGYMPQLDGLRALAVGAVVLMHFVPAVEWLGFGAEAGVRLFFTLSGFLITGILLKSRDAIDAARQTPWQAVRRFYARRFLRIFPLYYGVIGVALLVHLPPTRDIVWPLVTYTLNLHMAAQGWYEANFAHFWSLAVEEQFYVVWPFVMVLAPRRWLLAAALLMTAIGPVYRASYVWSGYQNMTPLSYYIATWSCLDSLGAGALLALAGRLMTPARLTHVVFRRVLPLALPAMVILGTGVLPHAAIVGYYLCQAAVAVAVIHAASHGLPGLVGRTLQSGPLQYAGRISYGLYVYHPIVGGLCEAWTVRALGSGGLSSVITVALSAGLSIGLAALSWAWFERPLNDLKRHFVEPRVTAPVPS